MRDIYLGDIGVEIRLDTGIDLSQATLLQIKVSKPTGNVIWAATQYGVTQSITYTTILGDLDVPGNYVLQSYVEIGSSVKLLGNAVTIEVLNAFTPNQINDIQTMFGVLYRYVTIQTYDQATANPITGTDCDILYDSFGMYLELAQDELVNLLAAHSIPVGWLTDREENALLCHLVAESFEQGNPDWSNKTQSQSPGVSFSRGANKDGIVETGPRLAIDKMLDQVELAVKRTGYAGGRRMERLKIKDSKNYPRRWKRSDIPNFSTFENDYDATEVKDLGQSIYDQNPNNTTSPW